MITMNPVKPTVDTFTAQATKDFGDRSKDFLAVYPATSDDEATQSAGDFVSDRFIAYSTWAWLEAQVKTGEAPVYRYRFDLGSGGDKFHPAATGAFHSDDIEYVFGTLDARPDGHIRPEDRALSAEIQQYWTDFARNGNPNAPDLPVWPTYGPKNDWQVMHLDTHSEAKPDTQRARYQFLDSVWSKPVAP
jgi:para-nitrobenzyl esterase